MQDPTEFLFVAMLLCSSMSCTLSMFSMFAEQGGGKGGFGGGFWRGLTNPVGATGDLISLMQGKQPGNTMQQVSKSDECKFKCGDCSQKIWDFFEERQGKAETDGRKAWCLGEGGCCPI